MRKTDPAVSRVILAQPVICHSPVLRACEQRGGRDQRGDLSQGWGQRGASHKESIGKFPTKRPTVSHRPSHYAPKMPSTDGSCPSTQGHLLLGAALMLCRLTVSPAHLPLLQSPMRPGSLCFRQVASCLKPLGWYLPGSSPAHPVSQAQCVHVGSWDSTSLLSEYGC